MKTLSAVYLAVAMSAGCAALATASENSTVSNTTSTSIATNDAMIGVQDVFDCMQPIPLQNTVLWYYNSKANGPYICDKINDDKEWYMMNAYRSGGTQGVHWKYTDDVNDKECLKDWKYYTSDGQSLYATIPGRTTLVNESRRWCALPVYRSGGVKGKQWDECFCKWIGLGRR